jgi:hypothetical protein
MHAILLKYLKASAFYISFAAHVPIVFLFIVIYIWFAVR